MMHQNNKKSKAESYQPEAAERNFIGVDLSLESLDVCCAGKITRLTNDKKGLEKLFKLVGKSPKGTIVAYESTGWLSRNFAMQLARKGISQTCVNPSRVRNYARALGIKAKTDSLDSQAIARYASDMDAKENVSNNLALLKLKELETAYEFFSRRAAQARTAMHSQSNKLIANEMQKAIAHDEKQLARIEKEMEETIRSDEELSARYDFYKTLRGIGPRIGMALTGQMPELGTLNRRQAESLAGVAPFNWDSGKMNGKRIPRFGRKWIRSLLYLSVVSSLRYKDSPIRDFYMRLKKEGKSSKTAIVAGIRKLLIWINSETRKCLAERARQQIETKAATA